MLLLAPLLYSQLAPVLLYCMCCVFFFRMFFLFFFLCRLFVVVLKSFFFALFVCNPFFTLSWQRSLLSMLSFHLCLVCFTCVSSSLSLSLFSSPLFCCVLSFIWSPKATSPVTPEDENKLSVGPVFLFSLSVCLSVLLVCLFVCLFKCLVLGCSWVGARATNNSSFLPHPHPHTHALSSFTLYINLNFFPVSHLNQTMTSPNPPSPPSPQYTRVAWRQSSVVFLVL